MGRKSIEMTAQPIRLDSNIASRSALSPFENCMLDEMADAVEFRRFVAGTASHPNPGRY